MTGAAADAYPTLDARQQHNDVIEARLAEFTREHDAEALAQTLQSLGIEAVPVADFGDLFEDTGQMATRGHFLGIERPQTGLFHYERNGYRLSNDAGGYPSASPLLGEHTAAVLRDALGFSDERIAALQANGALD